MPSPPEFSRKHLPASPLPSAVTVGQSKPTGEARRLQASDRVQAEPCACGGSATRQETSSTVAEMFTSSAGSLPLVVLNATSTQIGTPGVAPVMTPVSVHPAFTVALGAPRNWLLPNAVPTGGVVPFPGALAVPDEPPRTRHARHGLRLRPPHIRDAAAAVRRP
jgi:hypothetical protein